ncbi:purine-cytosine permease family protein [Roseovarius sp. Pro17]|uniref:purine-cytosine permease family protein n=1 Tax=Roseovarius sp. Pro17 TaxID=3108175 RepID=UPI002D778786|nr:cytosine permease [Roseovarius sp. Pro17]
MKVEQTTVQQIPLEDRKGRPRHLLWIWFSINVMPLTIITGVLGPSVYSLSFGWTVAAIIIGNLIGAIFTALHSAQGPGLGIPQMIQSRAQFGSYGALAIVFVAIFAGVGFAASIFVLGGQALHQLSSAISVNLGIFLVALAVGVVLVFGYDLFHKFNRVIVGILGLGALLTYVWILGVNGLPDTEVEGLGVSFSSFLGMTSLAVVWQLAYAPYVSDYSRYMAPEHAASASFWTTYWGTATGAAIFMILGALIGSVSGDVDTIGAIAGLTAGIAGFIMLTFVLGTIDAGMINIYTPMLSVVTIGQTFCSSWMPRAPTRILISAILLIISVFIAIFGQEQFLTNFTFFIYALLYLYAPWTAINLVDYYMIREGDYDVASILRADGGIYGKFQPIGFTCYVMGILIQIPFMVIFPIAGVTDGYTGVVAAALDGADIAWLVGIGVTAPIYYFWYKAAGPRVVTLSN